MSTPEAAPTPIRTPHGEAALTPIGDGEAVLAVHPGGALLIEADHVSKSFLSADGSTLHVLDDVSLTLHEGEVVALPSPGERVEVPGEPGQALGLHPLPLEIAGVLDLELGGHEGIERDVTSHARQREKFAELHLLSTCQLQHLQRMRDASTPQS